MASRTSSACKSLIWLNLWNTPVGNAGMEHVAKLEKLLYLNLDNTAVDDDGLKVIATLPELLRLTLNETGIHGRWARTFGRLQNAQEDSKVRLTAVSKKGVAKLKAISEYQTSLAVPFSRHTTEDSVFRRHVRLLPVITPQFGRPALPD